MKIEAVLALGTSGTTRLMTEGLRLLEKLTVPQLVENFPAFCEAQGSSPCSEQPDTCSYPEPDQSQRRTAFAYAETPLEIHFI